ncbi:MAG TPA: glycosyltransferase [Ornithinimicrobium sp.]|uniref:glycosyltransferase n=1 Tax=Ornithinimicrobium sp. TaxID=1977084 RepID=UPI002B46D64B|nr:glycosyltransferase [Ornithinimicrobium sp.]HKJ13071.1 glycosyltransferase [Ornithinimicrobium sp.]
MTAEPVALPRVAGQEPRVAVLVYNHAAHDSRVLKTAVSLRAAGAQVSIFAVARSRAGYPPGPGVVGDGVPVRRAPEFELARSAPALLRLARLVTGRRAQPELADAPSATPPAPWPVPSTGPAPGPPPAPGIVQDLWLRAYRTLSLALYWWHAFRSAASYRPHVVHACDGNTLAPAMALSAVTGAKVVYDSHELWLRRNVRPDRPVAPWVEAAIEWAGVRWADGVITVSPSIATWLRRRYRLPVEPALVRNAPLTAARVHRGGVEDEGEAEAPVSLRDRAGLGADAQVVAYAGRMTTARGLEETLAALALLPSRVHLVLLGYGEPDYLATLHAHAAELGLQRRIHVVAAVQPGDVPAVLSTADVSVVIVRPVCLSYRFSLPNKVFESIHAGVPVVAADLPDLASLVRRYGVGEVVDVSSPSRLAEVIAAVLERPEPYRRAAASASHEISWAGEARRLLGLYSRVLGP